MLCDKCWGMLRGHEGRVWKGTCKLHFDQHQDLQNLQDSAERHCGICRKLLQEWRKEDGAVDQQQIGSSEPSRETDSTTTEPFSSTASLSVVRDVDKYDLFRLDFDLKRGEKIRKRTFVLKQTGRSDLSTSHM